MTVGAKSYGTAADVAALTPRWTASGSFSATTNPTLTNVEKWIDGASRIMNTYLAAAGFSAPIVQEDAKGAVAEIVLEVVAERVRYVNNAGRFYTVKAQEYGVDPMRALRNEMGQWVEDNADGLELLGATRTRASTAGILFRDTDESGNETFPIFQRNGFSNSFTDWDGGD